MKIRKVRRVRKTVNDHVRQRGTMMKIWFVIPAGILLVMLLVVLYIWYSPWPAVWLLRHGDDGAVTVPAGFEEQVKGVRLQKDMTYPSQCKRNSFDLYMPAKEEKAPLILWIHGGAFVAGDKSGLVNWGKLLASEGYAVASMNYEWAPEAAWPSQVVQVAECLEELRRLSQQGEALDMENVFLAGDSAGAHIAMQAATAWYSEVFAKEAGILRPFDGKAEALKGILLYCGPYDIEAFTRIEDAKLRFFMNKVGQSYLGERQWQESDRTKYLHIASWITPDCPPVYITDGNSGSFEAQGRRLGDALRRLGVPVSERYFPKEAGEIPHEYQMDLAGPEGAACYQDTLEFLNDQERTVENEGIAFYPQTGKGGLQRTEFSGAGQMDGVPAAGVTGDG